MTQSIRALQPAQLWTANVSRMKPMNLTNKQLAARLRRWSTNCLTDGLHWNRREPTLQELLAEAARRLAVPTAAEPR